MTATGGAPGWRRHGRRSWVAAALAAATVLTAGCGVQPMDVPVDAGPAPSRVSCTPPEQGGDTDVYLECGSRVEAVPRELSPDGAADDEAADDLAATAEGLLAELQAQPSDAEREAGFTSSVPQDLRIAAPAGGDPGGLLRLNRHPDDLPAVALVQIICTFARSSAADGADGVLLSGPAEDSEAEPRRYQCAEALRHHPDGPGPPGSSA